MTVLPQACTEALLTEALARCDLTVERGVTFESLAQEQDDVRAVLRTKTGPVTVVAPVLLGADGSHSRVREVLDIAFEGPAFPFDPC